MPAYIKMYYACTIYFLLWAAIIFIWLTYNLMHYGVEGAESLLATLIAYLVVAIVLAKGAVSVKAWQSYRQAMQLTNTVKRLFIIVYYVTLLLGMGMLLLNVFVIPDDLKRSYAAGFNLDATIILLDGGVILLTLACIYFAIADWFLLKAINKKYEENLLSFEVD